MNRKEALLAECVVNNWHLGFRELLFSLCSLPLCDVDVHRNVRLRATDIAWREFDILSDPFHLSGQSVRLIFELKNGGVGYRSIAQVLFYKNVLAPKHSAFLAADRLIFIVIGARPNPKRWFGKGNLESDAEEFLKLIKPEYWPDPDTQVFSYDQLGLRYDGAACRWQWRTSG